MDAYELAELERVSAEFMKAMGEAQQMARAGEYGEPLREVLRYCRDLLDIAGDYLAGPNALEGARGALLEMTERLAQLQSLVSP